MTAIPAIHGCAVRMGDASRGRNMENACERHLETWEWQLLLLLCWCLVSLMHQVYIKIFYIRYQLLPEFFFHQLPENVHNLLHAALISFPQNSLKRLLKLLHTTIIMIVNRSLAEGILHSSFKHAVVQPLKSLALIPLFSTIFRPFSKIKFWFSFRKSGSKPTFIFYVS